MRLPRFGSSRHAIRDRLLSPVPLTMGAGIVAAAGGVLWRVLNGGNPADSPDQIAALTAQAVADAARESVLETMAELDGGADAALTAVATKAVREAATAGADITAAAIGAVDGAAIVASEAGLGRADAATAARLGALTAARDIGPAALDRVERVLDRRR